MYSFYVSELVKKHLCSDDELQVTDLSWSAIQELILKELLTWRDSPVRQYLLQCANWEESEFTKGKWIAYSPIYSRYSSGSWPVYDLTGLEFTNEAASIEFHSWKGDYDPQTYGMPWGNLPYRGPQRNLKGTVWTRGE